MTPREFYDTVVKMRYYQKEYYRQTEWNDVKKAALAKSKQFERAIEMINSYGFKGEYFIYTMIGGNNGFEECFNRINYWREKLLEFRKTKQGRAVYAYAQPYRDPNKARHEIPMWQMDMARWCNKRMIFATCDFKEFQPRKGFVCKQYFQ